MGQNIDIEYTDIKKLLSNCNKVAISGHVNPDGDAIGACLAFALCMEEIGKQPFLLLENIPKRYSYLNGTQFVYKGTPEDLKVDAFITIDTASKERISKGFEPVFDKTDLTINIDHHASNPKYAKYNYVDTSASSASEICFSIINELAYMNKEIAECIYTGLVYDTGGFRHKCTTPKTLEIASKLISIGIDFSDIYRNVLYLHSPLEAKLLAVALGNLEINSEYNFAYTYVSADELLKNNATSGDLEGVVDYIANIENMMCAFFVHEKESGLFKVSLRSKKVDVNKIASVFGGGGHKLASGCAVTAESLNAVIELISTEIKKEMN